MRIPKWLQLVLVVGLTAFILWFSFKDIDAEGWATIRTAFNSINWFWIGVSVFFAVLSHLSRALRWKMMLDTLGKTVKFSNPFLSLMVSYFINLMLPRAGEAARAAIISKYEKISIDKVVGTIVNDRAIDIIFLVGLTGLAFLLQVDVIGSYALEIFQAISQKILTINYWLLIASALIGIATLWFLAKKFNGIFQKVMGLAKNVWQGILSVKNVKSPAMFIFHSCFIWFMYFLMMFVCFQALPFTQHLGWQVGLVLFAFGTWGFVLTPGGIGAYPLAIAAVLSLYGIEHAQGMAFGWIVWFVQTVLNILGGSVSLLILPLLNKE